MVCDDCGRSYQMYMVQKELWKKKGVGRGEICLRCLTKRLGRPLRAKDFTDFPVNRTNPIVQRIRRGEKINFDDFESPGDPIYKLSKPNFNPLDFIKNLPS